VVVADSPGKLNVFLEVRGKRPDGYHELETVMLRTTFCDRMSFQLLPTPELRLSLTASTPAEIRGDFPLDQSNLILKAATALQAETGCRHGAAIAVHKRIPPQSGLAGGSGNAACTLLMLNRLWQAGVAESRLHQLAAELGSDINFLLSGSRAAVCRGRGELLTPIHVSRPLFFVATRPPQGNSTGQVFRQTEFSDTPESSAGIVQVLSGALQQPLRNFCFNRLTSSACQLNGLMADLLDQMQLHLKQPAFMSGSGSTCFVAAENHRHAVCLRAGLQGIVPWPVWILRC
jgi:4-diphosphocytidyl-2-C-methyl-D-erythritol kinase